MRPRPQVITSCILVILQSMTASCLLHQRGFEVVRHSPTYLLRSPDAGKIPFPEVLRKYNGFEPWKSWIDLRPLMGLRIENAYYQKGASRRGLQGYLGTEVAQYEVEPKGLQLLSVRPMPDRPATDLPVQELISPAVRKANYYRLYFEIVFNAVTNTHGSVLLAGQSTEEIDQLSAQLGDPETFCRSHSTHCTAFPEACSVSVEMEVWVNGESKMLIWGSLLSSIVGDRPQTVEVKRLYDGRLAPIKINAQDASALLLPLLPGDRIHWH